MNTIATPKNTRFRRCALVAGAVLLTLPCLSAGRDVAPLATPAPKTPQNQNQGPEQAQIQNQIPAHARNSRHHWYQIGRASWYGSFFQGHETASGEDFDMNAMTCAHRSLPLGSVVKVTNLRNNKSVVVRVNDRGPLPGNRIVDLSYAAAGMLGFSRRGTAPVRVELVSGPQLAQMTFPASSR
jgi:rare lipoprotein A